MLLDFERELFVDFVSDFDFFFVFFFFDRDRDFACDFDFRFVEERDRDFLALRSGEPEPDFPSDFDLPFRDRDRDLASDFDFFFAEEDRDSDDFFFLRSFLSALFFLRGVGDRLGLGVLLRELFDEDFLRFLLLLRDFRLDLLRERELFRLLTERLLDFERLREDRLRDEPLRPREFDRRLVRCLAGTNPPFEKSSLFLQASS